MKHILISGLVWILVTSGLILILGCDASSVYEACTVERSENSSTIRCSDGSVSVIPDGQDGSDGSDGVDGNDGQDGVDSVTELIDPCGDGPGEDELLVRLSSGKILAWYKNLGLVALGQGSYVTTDKQKCLFTVDSIGNVSW